MDASAGAGPGRGGAATPVQNASKEWRVVSEHHSSHAASVPQGREPADVDFCSITIDGVVQNDILQQRLNHVSRQREELQQMEVELRARVVVRSEVMEMRERFEAQIKEHASNAVLIQEQICGRDQTIQELERKMEDKDREIHAIKLDNEAAWAKEGLLREQNKELASFRRERDNSDAERVHHFQQIHDLQEHVKEKERQFIELQEQQRAAQETILYKDEQLREAQTWMTRAHEMDTIHTTNNQSLQAELRDRTEQYNQLWVGCQRQFAEMEGLHFSAVQQLQLELVEARERNGLLKEESAASHPITKDAPQFVHDKGHHEARGSLNGKSAEHSNGNEENATNFAVLGNASQAENNPGVPFTPSLLELSSYLSHAQMAVHPFMVHQQVLNPASSHAPQYPGSHFQSVQANSPTQYWQNQQYETPADGQTPPPQHVGAHVSQGVATGSMVQSAAEESQDQRSVGNARLVEPQSQHSLQDIQNISSQFQDTLNLNHLEDRKIQEGNVSDSNDHGQELRNPLGKTNNGVSALISDIPVQPANSGAVVIDSNASGAAPLAVVSATHTNLSSAGKTSDSVLLDERSLLACIARTMPASGKIQISSTLPNRLVKMLAPLHWRDYMKVYGKLDDFVVGHPELFVIEGDFIQVREGAQRKIAATAAAAKVAAAAAAPSPHSAGLLSVAVTPLAQSYRLKKSPSSEADHDSHYLPNQAPHSNGIHFQSGTKTVSSSANHPDLNGSENRLSRPNASMPANLISSANARTPANFAVMQLVRSPGTTPNSRR